MRNGGGSISSSNGRGSGVSAIPAASKKMVQSLKEIVNRPDDEIYAMLNECNMDPDDAVSRLLSQDTFHMVKSKREKKKEIKENTESRSRVVSGMALWGRGGIDCDVERSRSTKFNSSDSGVIHSKAAHKKDDGAHAVPKSPSASGLTSSDVNCQSISQRNHISTETKIQEMSTSDEVSLSSKPSSGFQPVWFGAPGHLTMADIVKMGRPHAKTSNMQSTATSHSAHNVIMSNMSQKSANNHLYPTCSLSDSYHYIHSSQDPALKVSDIIHETGLAVNQDTSSDDWPVVETSTSANGPSVSKPSDASVTYLDSSSGLYVDLTNLDPTESDEAHIMKTTVSGENQILDSIESAATSDRQIQVDNTQGSSCFDDSSFKNGFSYKSQSPIFDHQEAIPNRHDPSSVEDFNDALSSAAASLRQLSLQGEISVLPAGENPAVIIPNHLQVPTSDCSHLSFGSFGSGLSAGFSGSFVSNTMKSNLGEISVVKDGSSVEHLESRNCETSNETVGPPSSSQPEVPKQDSALEATHGHQYPCLPSVPGLTIENTEQANAAGYSYSQANSQMQDLASFSSVMQASASSLPSNLSTSTVQHVRESDLPYSQFTVTQSMATKYNSGMSSISGPTVSVPEAVKPSIFTMPQPTLQTLASTTVPTASALPQHLAMHPYSQPALFANMITYPFLPQSYTYMPSAFQQAYAANSVYHQSPATFQSTSVKYPLPQYKNSISVSSLPQPPTIASGYGGFGSSTNFPGNFVNPSTAPSTTTIGHEEVMGTQYKDSNHYGSQQSEPSTMWINGSGSRTMSALPGSTYYGFQGQNQHGVIRQSQQHSHYGAPGHPNFYHSPTVVPQEHQHTPNDGALIALQGPPSQQSHQIWQHSY